MPATPGETLGPESPKFEPIVIRKSEGLIIVDPPNSAVRSCD